MVKQVDERAAVDEALAAHGMAGGDRRCVGQSGRRHGRRRDGAAGGADAARRDRRGRWHDLGSNRRAGMLRGRRRRARSQLRFGAKSAPDTGVPIDKLVTIRKLVHNAEMKFGESFAPFGDAAWISFDGIDVILNSTRAQSFDPSLFSAMGIDPTKQKILLIKSTNHFYNSFSKIAASIIYCSAGHPYPNEPKHTAYRKAPRNIWPIVENPFA